MVSLIFVNLVIVAFYLRRKLKNKGENLMLFDLSMNLKADDIELSNKANNRRKSTKREVELPLFSFSSVAAATNNFSDTNKLGEGDFGPVYKGVLAKGDEIAVKRLSVRSRQGLQELKNEALVIAKVQHKNLVRLLGCCIERDEKLLIYEYLPNKSLDFFLFDATKRLLLELGTRLQIIEGIVEGLLYLHLHSKVRIIHRDLKASNILLDKEMKPKISDFGMARIFKGNESKANTNRVAGTFGYIPPEYVYQGICSIKSDKLSGKKNTEFYHTGYLSINGYAWDLWTSNRVLELVDPVLLEDASCSKHMLSRYVNIALLCVQERADERPTMSDVDSMLKNEAATLPPPKQPAYSHVRSTASSAVSPACRPEDCSINQITDQTQVASKIKLVESCLARPFRQYCCILNERKFGFNLPNALSQSE
ncbi:hypothetical protein CUMW_263360 [Citrus unshiu]|uniref:non-specific serine/threonine protein kinase n=1 Tax=Citrus unshiu TaxID=55188 RepID=A0A2H5QUP8_CITUN|nr:hypothetical protein CUMW_263360 [Citrus unshiu]